MCNTGAAQGYDGAEVWNADVFNDDQYSEATVIGSARIGILEGNMSKAWVEIGQIQDRQKGLTAANGIFATIVAIIAGWVGTQR